MSAVIVAPAEVITDATAQLMSSTSPGTLILSIPGSGSPTAVSGAAESAPLSMKLSSTGVSVGGAVIFSSRDPVGMNELVGRLAASGGTLSTGGVLGGVAVQVIVVTAREASGGGTVAAIVTYN